jgi:hypothetical protein
LHCGRALHLRWTVCPYCGTAAVTSAAPAPTSGSDAGTTQEARRARRAEESATSTAEA